MSSRKEVTSGTAARPPDSGFRMDFTEVVRGGRVRGRAGAGSPPQPGSGVDRIRSRSENLKNGD